MDPHIKGCVRPGQNPPFRERRTAISNLINSSARCMVDVEQSSAADITHWLLRWREGDQEALDRLTLLVYHQLRHIAAALLYKERPGHTLQPTALVHELYFRLATARDVDWKCRGQFFAISAKLMRRILLDHARA